MMNQYRKEKLQINPGSIASFFKKDVKTNALEFQEDDDEDFSNLEVNGQTMKRFARLLKVNDNIETLSISFKYQRLTDNEFDGLMKGIRRLGNLTTLSFHFGQCREMKKGIASLAKVLPQIPSLQNLELKFVHYSIIKDADINSLSKGIKKLVHLKRFNLNLSHDNSTTDRLITDKDLKNICKALKSLASLRDIELNFGTCGWITDTGIKDLAKTLKTLTSLESIDLDFAQSDEISKESLSPLAESLKNVRSLQKLHLDFEWAKMGNKCVCKFIRVLKNFVHLKSLGLNLKNFVCGILYEGFLCFASEMRNLQSLKNLDLKLRGDSKHKNLNDVLMEFFGNDLKNLPSLQSLKLEFMNWRMTNRGLENFGQALTVPPSLRNIDIIIDSPYLTEEGLHAFLSSLTSLQEISLDILYNQKLGDSEIFPKRKDFLSLKALNIRFRDWAFKDYHNFQTLEDISSFLTKLKSLKSLVLHYFQKEFVSDEGIEQFSEALRTLPSLEIMDLRFTSCITEIGMINLVRNFNRITSLEKIRLYLDSGSACLLFISPNPIHPFSSTLEEKEKLNQAFKRLNCAKKFLYLK